MTPSKKLALVSSLLAAALLVSHAAAAAIHKCKTPDGKLLYQETPCANEAQTVSSISSHTGADADNVPGNTTLVIGQGRGGHYFVDGAINDHFMNFMIDTGASYITIPRELATAAGLKCKSLATMQTGNGATSACLVTIDKLTFGGFTLRHVDALAAPNLDQPLIGMNVLKRFNFEQQGGQIRLTKNY